ncbi:MAG: helix-turn-helix domain-containing protein [Deltaproteobacteria bacterium]|nr:helix-turn-helix domain-containing protein [Deltaproteobacteria bacterium]
MKRIVMVGKELRAIRARLRLTQVELAELVGVASNTVARWERDEMAMRERKARLIQGIYATGTKRGKEKR